MMRHGNRTIKVNKNQIIEKIKENKAAHIEAYNHAVIAYKEEALKQLAELTQKAQDGDIKIRLNLITPIDNSERYDEVLEMFQWEVDEVVELEQSEFTDYVQDQIEFAKIAKVSNSAYYSG